MVKTRANNIRWGIVLTYLILATNIVVSIIYTPIMLGILGPSEHGLYNTVTSTMSWLNLLSLGLGSSYIRYYSIYKSKQQETSIHKLNGLFLIIFSILGAIVLGLGFVISQNLSVFFGDGLTSAEYNSARVLSVIVTIDLAIGFPISVFSVIIRAQEQFIQAKLLNLFQAVAHPLISLPLLWSGYGSVGIVLGTLAINVVTYVANIIICIKKLRIQFVFKNFEKGLLKEMLAFSFFIAINSIINQVNTSLDKILLARFVNTTSVSIYTIGFSLYSYYSAFSSAISGIFVPRINKIVNENLADKEKLKSELTAIFVKIGRIQFYIQMLMLTGIIFFGQRFIFFWAGEGYKESYYIALMLAVAYTIPLCQSIGVEIQRAQNKHQTRTIVYIVMTLFNIILTVFLCQLLGGIGAAVGTAISVFMVEGVFMNIYYHRSLNIDIVCFWKNILRVSLGLLVPLGVGVCIFLWFPMGTIWQMFLGIGIYCIVYCISMWLVSFNSEEKSLVLGLIKKLKKKKRADNVTE